MKWGLATLTRETSQNSDKRNPYCVLTIDLSTLSNSWKVPLFCLIDIGTRGHRGHVPPTFKNFR